MLLAQLQIDGSLFFLPWSGTWIHETLCSMLVGLACGVLGTFVVLRRMALIGDALSHAVLPGVVVAFIVGSSFGVAGPTSPVLMLAGALIAGLLTAVGINLVGRFSRAKEDSAIGIVFTAMFAIGVILISSLERGTHFDLKCFLFGDPLAITDADLVMMAVICPIVLLAVAIAYHRLKLVSFDPLVAAAMGVPVVLVHYLLMGLLSATIVAGLKTTGVILVVAMVITPASAAYQLTNRFGVMLVLSGVFGAVSAALGMSLAFVFNSPTGPAMVLVAAGLFGLCVIFSPGHGWLFDTLRRRKLTRHVENEDVLKGLYRLGEADGDATAAIAADRLPAELSFRPAKVDRLLRRLRGEGLVRPSVDDPAAWALTDTGRHHAEELVRSHRLWETYLADEAGLDPELVHGVAEQLEHAHDLTERLDAALNRPDTDPHGQPIPRG